MVLYSPAVASRYDIATLVNNSAASMNSSFLASNVDASVRVVHYGVISGYSEPSPVVWSTLPDIAVDMRDGTSPFASVPGLRDSHAADVVIFLYDGSKNDGVSCGWGFVPSSSAGDDDAVYSVTGDECIAPFNNFAHEIGHTLGGDHD